MKLTFSFTTGCVALLLSSGTALAQTFKPYYSAADGQQKASLKTALYNIVSQHHRYTYSDLWRQYETTDADPQDPTRVVDLYSDEEFHFNGNGNAVSGMNKEHVMPQSWWGKGGKYDIYTDLFNVLPSESKANSAKSNLPLGIVTGNITFQNSRCRVGAALQSGGAGKVFEPCDEYKGDFARIYFYDAVCYQQVPWADQYGWAVQAGGSAYPTLNQWIIDLLLEWNRQDPPSEWEVLRNERVYRVQENRNPFVDFPQLAEYIWGDSISYSWDLARAVPNQIADWTDTTDIGPITPPDTIPEDTTIVNPPQPGKSELLFAEAFDGITAGNDYNNSGSSSPWTGNDNIAAVNAAYQAGGAVRLGTSKKNGSLTTIPLDAAQGEQLTVSVQVKGWTTVEGQLCISLTSCADQTLAYTATMSDPYETLTATFPPLLQDSPQLTLATTAGRCFISDIRVTRPAAPEPEEPWKQYDMNGDDQLGIDDITALIQHYLDEDDEAGYTIGDITAAIEYYLHTGTAN